MDIIEPYLAAITKHGFCRTIPDNPEYRPLVVIDASTFKFNRDAKFESNNKMAQRGLSWWTGGMQSRVVDSVQIICDDPDELFVLFLAMNDERYPYLLGKLVDDNDFTERHKAAFAQFFEISK